MVWQEGLPLFSQGVLREDEGVTERVGDCTHDVLAEALLVAVGV